MTSRLSGYLSLFGLVFFVLKPPLGIARRWSRKKFAIKPRSHVRILVYRRLLFEFLMTSWENQHPQKIAKRFRDRKLLLFFKFYTPRSQKPSMNFYLYTGLLHAINGKYAWKYFNCSAIPVLVGRKPVQKYFGMSRPLPRPRPRPCPPALPHARFSYCCAICIIMWYWGLPSHACNTSSSIFVG